jgi:hypothetical protein
MSTERTKWWKTPPFSNIIGGLVVAIIIGLSKLAYDVYRETPVLSTLSQWKEFVISSFLAVANFPIKLWWIIVFLIFVIIVLIVVNLILGNNNSSAGSLSDNDANKGLSRQSQILQKQLDYTAERFGSYIWKWEWIYNTLIKKYEVKNIVACCPNPICDNLALKQRERSSARSCDNCLTEYFFDVSTDTIQKMVEKEARDMESPHYELQKSFRSQIGR